MKKIISNALTLFLLLAVVTVNAQGYTFRVLANKGENKVKKAGTADAVRLKTGATLNSDDLIISTDGSYIGLMHKTGKTTEVRGAGTQKVSEIEKQIKLGNSTVAGRYASYVMEKMSEEENSNVRTQLHATGAVERAMGSSSINILAPSQIDVLGDKTIIRWAKIDSSDISYTVKVKNIFDEVIYEAETEKTFVELDFTAEQMANDAGLYLVTVFKTDDENVASSEVGLKKIKEGDREDLKQNLDALKSEVTEETSLNKLIFASFYEQNGLLLDALTEYEEAIKMSPEIEDFQVLYRVFLKNNGLAE